MDISSVPSSTLTLASTTPATQTAVQAQVAMLRELAEMQQQMAQMLADTGLGQTIDTHA